MAGSNDLYDQDFVRWTEEQAAALRRAKVSTLALDWENLAEEIESLGKSDRRALRSQTRRILRHLFKLETSPAVEPRTDGVRRSATQGRKSQMCCAIAPACSVRWMISSRKRPLRLPSWP